MALYINAHVQYYWVILIHCLLTLDFIIWEFSSPLPLIDVFWFWFFCLDIQIILYSPDSISQIWYVSLLKIMYPVSQEHGIYSLAKWKYRFIFQENFPVILSLHVCSVSMWASCIENTGCLNVGSSWLALCLCKLCPNYFSPFAFFIYFHWLSQVASALVIWFLMVSVNVTCAF